MFNEIVFRARVVSVMETLTAAAVRAVCQIMEESYAALRVEMECSNEPNRKPLTMEKETVQAFNPCRSPDRIQMEGEVTNQIICHMRRIQRVDLTAKCLLNITSP